MSNALIQCPHCQAWLVEGAFNRPQFAPCPACGAPLQIEIYPAFFRKIGAGQTGEAIEVEGESSCFYHPQKRAVLACDGCGRFVCALCDCPLEGKHYCPSCLEAGKTKGKIKTLEDQRVLYDGIALSLAIVPMLIFYLTLITAPMTLFVAIRYWKAPASILRRSKFRFVVAIVISLMQIGGWAALFTFLATRHRHHA
jgi:hypothetical protein